MNNLYSRLDDKTVQEFADYKIVKENSLRFHETKESIFAEKYNLDEADIKKYAQSMNARNLGGANYALGKIRSKVAIDNQITSLVAFAKLFSPIRKDLYTTFGDVDQLTKDVVLRSMEERNMMEAARKRAEEEMNTETKRLQEFQDMNDKQLDKEYFKAIEDNNEQRMRDLVNEAARRKGYVSTDEFRMAHRAPTYDEEGIDKSMVDIAANKDQIRESINELLHMNRDKDKDESAVAINEVLSAIDKGKKTTATIYRAVPKSLKEGKARNGDWVSLSEAYVKIHGEHALNGDYRIMKEEVPVENLYWDGNDINEWGYDDRSEYRYKDTINNRKLNDLITRDDKGNIIPPSKRFNARKIDLRFRFIGEKGAANLDKAEKATTRLDNLDIARKMELSDKEAKIIKKSTGWERGADGLWRYETEDAGIWSGLRLVYKKDSGTTLDVILEDCREKDELFNAYPDLKGLTVNLKDMGYSHVGEYDRTNNAISLNTYLLTDENGEFNEDNTNRTLVHEIQHAIQGIEGFERGGDLFSSTSKIHEVAGVLGEDNDKVSINNLALAVENGYVSPDAYKRITELAKENGFDSPEKYIYSLSPYTFYRNISGEVEARNVQRRLKMTQEERRNNLASETEDVTRGDQIFLNDAFLGISASMDTDIDKINQKFNAELLRYQNGEMGNNEILHLGTPQGAMLSFIPELPIIMRQKAVRKGFEKKHNVDINTLLDMPSKISSPIFVFQRSDNTIGILTEMKDRDGKKVCVAIEMSKSIQDGGKVLEVNDVQSLHGREIQNIIYPIINNGTLRWVDKEKALDWFSSVSQPVQQEITNKELSSATKIVASFVNPTIKEGIITSAVSELTESLNTPVHIVRDVSEITDDDQYLQRQKRCSKGWYDTDTGETYLVLSNAESVSDAQSTVLHEVVGHKGLRGLLGDRFDEMMDVIYKNLSETIKDRVAKDSISYNIDIRVSTEEYLASMVENGVSEPTVWNKIKLAIKGFFRSIGIELQMTNEDIAYLFWKSKNRLMKGDGLAQIAPKVEIDIDKVTEIQGIKITDQQRAILKKGGSLFLENLLSGEGKTFSAEVSFSQESKSFKYNFPGAQHALSKEQKATIDKGEKVLVTGLTSQKGTTYDAFFFKNMETGRIEKEYPVKDTIMGVGLSEQQKADLQKGRYVWIEGLKRKDETTFKAPVIWDGKKGKFAFAEKKNSQKEENHTHSQQKEYRQEETRLQENTTKRGRKI